MRVIPALLALISFSMISGPVPQGHAAPTQLSQASIDKRLINSKTTRSEVLALLGLPQSRAPHTEAGATSSSGGGAEIWSYETNFYFEGAHNVLNRQSLPIEIYGRMQTATLVVTFDARGIVTRHTYW